MEIKVRKRWVWGVVLLLSFTFGGVAAVQAAGGEHPSESEVEARVPFLQRLLRLSIPMPLVKEREEVDQGAGEYQAMRSQRLAEHALQVERETLQESVSRLSSEGIDSVMLSREAFRMSMAESTGVESMIYQFVHDSLRMRHMIETLARVSTGRNTPEFNNARTIVADFAMDFIKEAWSLNAEYYSAPDAWFDTRKTQVLPFLIFYLFEPDEGLVLLNALFDATVYATTVQYKYGSIGNSLRAEGITITTDERNNDVIKVICPELHIFVYVMCAYLERMNTDPKYTEHEDIVPVLDELMLIRDIALIQRNEQRHKQSMPEDQFLMLIPNDALPSRFEIKYVEGYMWSIQWFRMHDTDHLDYLYFMRDKLRELAVAFGPNGVGERD